MSKEEKIQKNINKYLLFPIEFIVSLIFSVLLYNFVCQRSYNGVISIKFLISSIIAAGVILYIITINFIENKDKMEKIFLSFMIPVGIMYLVFIIPTHVPDEQAHLWKSYEISEGIMLTNIDENGKFHSNIPRFFTDNIKGKMDNYNDMNEAMNQKTDYTEKREVQTSAESYNPLLYIFSSFGLLISKILGLNGILAIYIARMCNFIAFLVLSYYAIKIIPFGKLVLSSFLFLPMVLQQAMSISADSFTNTISIFFIAYSMYLVFKKEKINRKEQIIYVVLSILIGIAKVVYIPLVGLSFLFVGTKNLEKKNKVIVILTSIILSTVIAFAWYLFTSKYSTFTTYLSELNVNSSMQIQNLIKYPVHIIKVISETSFNQGEIYMFEMLGCNLGWLTINIPHMILFGFMILIVVSPFLEKNEHALSRMQKVLVILIYAVTIILIYMALYISWTPVGANIVEGIQGRYFIPIAILPFICFSMKDNYAKIKNINLIYMVLLTLLNLGVLKEIIKFFT